MKTFCLSGLFILLALAAACEAGVRSAEPGDEDNLAAYVPHVIQGTEQTPFPARRLVSVGADPRDPVFDGDYLMVYFSGYDDYGAVEIQLFDTVNPGGIILSYIAPTNVGYCLVKVCCFEHGTLFSARAMPALDTLTAADKTADSWPRLEDLTPTWSGLFPSYPWASLIVANDWQEFAYSAHYVPHMKVHTRGARYRSF